MRLQRVIKKLKLYVYKCKTIAAFVTFVSQMLIDVHGTGSTVRLIYFYCLNFGKIKSSVDKLI